MNTIIRRNCVLFLLFLFGVALMLVSCKDEHVHTAGEWENVSEATCTKDGKMEKRCAECGETIDTVWIPALKHTEVVVNGVAPTYTEVGFTAGSRCAVCNESILEREIIPARIVDDWIVLSYEGHNITETAYRYWFAKNKTLFLHAYNNGVDDESFWNTEITDGITYEDFYADYVKSYAEEVAVSLYLFDEYGLTLSSQQIDVVKSGIQGAILSFGGEEQLNAELGKYGMDVSVLEYVYLMEQKVNTLNEWIFRDNGLFAITDDDRSEYYQEHYYSAMWIYVYTDVKLMTDENGNYFVDENGVYKYEELTESEKQEKQMLVNELMKELAAGKDFKELRARYSEEGLDHYAAYPDGIILSVNDYARYGIDMMDMLQNLKVGEYGSFNNGYVTVFVKRLPLKAYSELTEVERALMVDFEEYVREGKKQKITDGRDITYFDEILNKFDVKKIPHWSNISI